MGLVMAMAFFFAIANHSQEAFAFPSVCRLVPAGWCLVSVTLAATSPRLFRHQNLLVRSPGLAKPQVRPVEEALLAGVWWLLYRGVVLSSQGLLA
jgi:hypothetical protein